MKTTSAILAVGAAVIGFAIVAPDANARPPSKSPGLHHFHKPKAEAKKKCCASEPKKGCCASEPKKTVGLSVEKSSKGKLRPYFQRKHGAPALRHGR